MPAYLQKYERFQPKEGMKPTVPTVSYGYDEVIAKGEAMQSVLAFVNRVAPLDAPVLISGETGAGKQLIARELHRLSTRNNKPLFHIDCSVLPDSLIVSSLFGIYLDYGDPTSAVLERANGGTLLIEEVGDVPFGVQAKLLHILQTGEFERFATHETIKTNVRIIATTTGDLAQMVTAGKFQSDFHFYLTAASIDIPPLRERREDIPSLLDHYVHLVAESLSVGPKKLSPDVVDFLAAYSWPGNVKELQVVLELSLLQSSSDTVRMADVPAEIRI